MRAPDKVQSLRVLRSRNIPIETIIDVGVLTNTWELTTVFPDKHHLLFEPVGEHINAIHAHYKGIKYTLVEAAVSDKEGDVTLKIESVGGAPNITHSQIISGPVDSDNKRVVPAVTLDGYLSCHRQNPPYLLKLDVDGFELQIIHGALETLKNTSVVIVEVGKHSLAERISVLEAHGFEIFDLVEPCYYDQSFWQCDAVMLKRSLHSQYFTEHSNNNFSSTKYECFHLRRHQHWRDAVLKTLFNRHSRSYKASS
jgi:FkbM family methyltransferase